MKASLYRTEQRWPMIRPAPKKRTWMTEHTYKCLPVTIGSMYGWQILCPCDVRAVWNGGPGTEDIDVTGWIARSHFGNGVLTFFPGFIFRLPRGYDAFVTGPINEVRPGITPLTGVIEYDYGVHTWSMNWRFNEPDRDVFWDAGEPFCQFFPVKRGGLEDWRMEIGNMPKSLRPKFEEWCEVRLRSIDEEWSKDYYVGKGAFEDHKTRLGLSEPVYRKDEDDSSTAS